MTTQPGQLNRFTSANSHRCDSTTGPTPLHRSDRNTSPVEWLNLAGRTQLERDLNDLPELCDLMERHYGALLARGSSNPDARSERYPIDPAVLDASDRRFKGGAMHDPIGEADLARRIGARRQGVLPTLEGWARMAEGEMLDLGIEHTEAANNPTVVSEAGWLSQHLAWIVGQQFVVELAHEVRRIVADLESIVGPIAGPDERACLTALEVADVLNVKVGTLWQWRARGLLTDVGRDGNGRLLFITKEVRTLKLGA